MLVLRRFRFGETNRDKEGRYRWWGGGIGIWHDVWSVALYLQYSAVLER